MITQLRDRVTTYAWLVRTLVRSGFLGTLRLDRYIRMGLNLRRHGGASPVSGIGLAAARAPQGLALVDEAGELTWGELDARCDALAVGLRDLPGAPVATVAILCRNHRGLIEALAASSRLGADAVLLNTGFAGPQLADVLEREGADVLIADDEFDAVIAPAAQRLPGLRRITAWTETGSVAGHTTDSLINPNLGQIGRAHV